MFVYSFKSKSLIKHVVISGNYITMYTSQEHCSAVQPLINHFELTSVSGDHPVHHLLHNSMLSFSNGLPHKHLKFSSSDRRQELLDICNFLLQRQHSPDLRKKDYDQLVQALNQEREDRGDKEFPEYINQSLAQYDLTTPFLPDEEIADFLKAFNQYTQSNSFAFYADMLCFHKEITLKDNWDILYKKAIFPDDTIADNFEVDNYYNYLEDLRIALLGMHFESGIKWCGKASQAIDNIKTNPYYKQLNLKEHDITKTLEEIQKKVNIKNDELNRNSIAVMAAGLIILDYFRVDSTKEYMTDTIAILLSCVATSYIRKPLDQFARNIHQFFFKPTPSSDKPIDSMIILEQKHHSTPDKVQRIIK